MRHQLSILLGSGFSIPEGIRGVQDLNGRLREIKESEIMIHSSQTALFLEGQEDNNRFMRQDERYFVEEFLRFYNDILLGREEKFHYETFFDFYSRLRLGIEPCNDLIDFCKKFEIKFTSPSRFITDPMNRIDAFHRTFSQLLASLLHNDRYFDEHTFENYSLYDNFIIFLCNTLKKTDIHVHSLNHDIFFEHLGSKHRELSKYFTDGFSTDDSMIYGITTYRNDNEELSQRYIKLPMFVDSFKKPLSLYKLHGSILNKVVHSSDFGLANQRIKQDYRVWQHYFGERNAILGEIDYHGIGDQTEPDFLSGTQTKLWYYEHDNYYKTLFNHFKKNLSDCSALLVIGYGFQDPGINQVITEKYLTRGLKVYIIDISRPRTNLLNDSNFKILSKSIVDVTECEFHELLNS